VIAETGVDPTRTLFVDDKVENVLSGRSCGLQGIVFEDSKVVARQLRNLCGDSPISRGRDFLKANRKNLKSFTSNGVILEEVS
jgi:FMN phosphatase YigB (HAD superfamily)